MANETKLSKSLSYKLLAGIPEMQDEEVKAHMKELAKTDTVLAAIAGEVTGYNVKNGQYGENIAFSGTFVAQSAITGEVFETTKIFFDKGFADQLRGRFDTRKDADEIIKFSCQISVVKHAKSPFFTYMTTPLRTPEAITRRAELLGTLASAPLQIAAPKKAAK